MIDLAVPTDLSYSFVASANATVSIGSWITNIQKAGHDHLWVAFEEVDDSSAKKVVPRPLAAYVERIYEQADFFTLGIGG